MKGKFDRSKIKMKNMDEVKDLRITQVLKHLSHAEDVISMKYDKRLDRIYVNYVYDGKTKTSSFPKLNIRGGIEIYSYCL